MIAETAQLSIGESLEIEPICHPGFAVRHFWQCVLRIGSRSGVVAFRDVLARAGCLQGGKAAGSEDREQPMKAAVVGWKLARES